MHGAAACVTVTGFARQKAGRDLDTFQRVSAREPNIPLASRVLEVCVREMGMVEVAKRLGVTPVLVDLWQTGQVPMPKHAFLKLVDVLVALTPGWAEEAKK